MTSSVLQACAQTRSESMPRWQPRFRSRAEVLVAASVLFIAAAIGLFDAGYTHTYRVALVCSTSRSPGRCDALSADTGSSRRSRSRNVKGCQERGFWSKEQAPWKLSPKLPWLCSTKPEVLLQDSRESAG